MVRLLDSESSANLIQIVSVTDRKTIAHVSCSCMTSRGKQLDNKIFVVTIFATRNYLKL